MATKSITFDQLPRELRELEKRAPERAAAAMIDAANRGKRDILSLVQERGVTDRGDYKRGWKTDVLPGHEGAILGNSASHAAIVEEGSRPHWAPLEPLIGWVLRKLIAKGPRSVDAIKKRASKKTKKGTYTSGAIKAGWQYIVAAEIARAIQRKIAAHGTPAREIMKDAYPKFPRYVQQAVEKELDKL